MRLHPVEFTADRESPFKHDRLNRRTHVEAFCRFLCGVDGHAVVSLDAPWGAGKTAFVRMCSAHLRSQEVRVVEFNAWRQSHTDKPLVDLVSAISCQVKNSKTKVIIGIATELALHLAKVSSCGLFDPEVFESDKSVMLAPWAEAEKQIKKFVEKLTEIASSKESPLVVVIDELDRCRPAYALALLETVRHLFAADGVMVVLAINRAELSHSIKSVYGPDFDADWYLRRFADLHIGVPPPDEQNLASFLDGLLETTGLSARFTTSSYSYSAPMLQLLAESPGRSLRDLEQAVHLAVVALASLVPADRTLMRTGRMVWEDVVVALIVLRVLDEAAYQRLAYGDGDGIAAVAALDKALGPVPDPQDNISHSGGTREQIEAFLILGSSDTLFSLDNHKEEFVERYTSAVAPDQDRAERVFDTFVEYQRVAGGRRPRVKPIADLIDLVNYTPVETRRAAE